MTLTINDRLTESEVDDLNRRFEKASPQEVLEWALEFFGRRMALAWSGGESVAILDMLWKIDPARTRVFSIDTGRLPAETYQVIDEVREKYKIDVEVIFPDAEQVQNMVRKKGVNLFFESVENRKLCCRVRKVEPLNRILSTLDAWAAGLRRSEGGSRADIRKIEFDGAHDGILKINPLADWTTEQVFQYIDDNGVPRNKLHALGYPSIGCAPCTRAIYPSEDERAGRWWWEKDGPKECGLHFPVKKGGG